MRKSGSFGVGREVCAGQIGVSNVIVMKYWGEVFGLDEFTILDVWGGTMIEVHECHLQYLRISLNRRSFRDPEGRT
jgi:hypothetical protein